MNYKKLNKIFSWKPKYKFEQVLPELIDWYKKYLFRNK
jgi:dTDP-D-glucose 4,6-dehydratase